MHWSAQVLKYLHHLGNDFSWQAFIKRYTNANFDINQPQPYKIKKEKLMHKASALLGENTACEIWDVISLGDPEKFKTLTQFKLN